MRTLIVAFSAAIVSSAALAGPELVNLPTDYKKSLADYGLVDRPDNKTVRDLYANAPAQAAAKTGKALPSGSVLVMDIFKAKTDDKGEPMKDANGRLIKGELANVFVMEKRAGWGAGYDPSMRNGEWEYAVFTPAGERRANADVKPCFTCHLGVAKDDFMFSLAKLKAK